MAIEWHHFSALAQKTPFAEVAAHLINGQEQRARLNVDVEAAIRILKDHRNKKQLHDMLQEWFLSAFRDFLPEVDAPPSIPQFFRIHHSIFVQVFKRLLQDQNPPSSSTRTFLKAELFNLSTTHRNRPPKRELDVMQQAARMRKKKKIFHDPTAVASSSSNQILTSSPSSAHRKKKSKVPKGVPSAKCEPTPSPLVPRQPDEPTSRLVYTNTKQGKSKSIKKTSHVAVVALPTHDRSTVPTDEDFSRPSIDSRLPLSMPPPPPPPQPVISPTLIFPPQNPKVSPWTFQQMLLLPPPLPTPIAPATSPPDPTRPCFPHHCKIPIWAKSRQEVCESLEWFKSYQGGVYFKDDLAHGYLLSGFPSERDCFEHNGKLIISHGGGKAASLHRSNGTLAKRGVDDQTQDDKSVKALIGNYTTQRPLVLLMDDAYKLFPYSLASRGAVYAVLGWYRVVAYWAERQAGVENKVRYKFAFQWDERQGQPWWHFEHKVPILPAITMSLANRTRECERCNRSSPHVYEQGWACMVPWCPHFLAVVPSPAPRNHQRNIIVDNNNPCALENQPLIYRKDFLSLRTIPTAKAEGDDADTESDSMDVDLPSIVRPLPTVKNQLKNTAVYAFTRGFHCSQCGRLSCRTHWTSWTCANCEHREIINVTIFSHNHFLGLLKNTKATTMSPTAGIHSRGIQTFMHQGRRGDVHTWILPHNRGKIHHIDRGGMMGLKQVNEIFHMYQIEAKADKLSFRRWPMRAHQCKGDLLTHYFSHNTGQPYNYVGGAANTIPFDQAPAVRAARDYLHDRVKAALHDTDILVEEFPEFNEVLSAAYLEKQSMAYHCDSEHGLGPVVAGLSLGAPALMEFRQKRTLNNAANHLQPQSISVSQSAVLAVKLQHGDILVMEGSGVQDYYEHRVTPAGFRIAATARVIDPSKNTNPLGGKPTPIKTEEPLKQ